MITLRRADQRLHERTRQRDVRRTFDPGDPTDPLADGFSDLEILDEIRLSPDGGAARTSGYGTEVLTYVREGALAHEDSTGRSGVVQAGELRRMTFGRGARHREMNASRTHSAQIFQIRLHPSQAQVEAGDERKRFTAAQRRGVLRVVASADARGGSLRIHQDALVCSALLDPGQHVAHELSPGRCAWLHIVQGDVTFGDIVLTTGDGAGITAERAVSLTAREETEILLFDLGPRLVAGASRAKVWT